MLRRQLPFVAVAAVLSIARSASAVPEPTPIHEAAQRAMSLREALAYAAKHQPKLRSARERLRAAQADAAVPGTQWKPSLGFAAELVLSTSAVLLPTRRGFRGEPSAGTGPVRPVAMCRTRERSF